MIEVTEPNTQKVMQIEIEKVALEFRDPDTGVKLTVPVVQIIEGGLDYKTINSHAYVYDKKNGYLSIQQDDSVMLRRLEPWQKKIIDDVLAVKEQNQPAEARADKDQEKEDAPKKFGL